MSDEGQITVASTTDGQQEVEQVATGAAFERKPEPQEPYQPSSGPKVASTTDTPAEVQKVQEDLNEQREDQKDEHLGRTRRKLLNQVRRQDETIRMLRSRLGDAPATPQPEQAGQPGEAPQIDDSPPEAEVVESWHRYQANLAAREEMAEEAKAKYPNLGEVLQKCDRENPLPPGVDTMLMSLPNPHSTAYFLAQDPATIAKIWQTVATNPGPQATKMVRNELKLLSRAVQKYERENRGRQAEDKQRPVTSAPAPIRPLGGGGGGGSASRRLDEMSYRDFKKVRDAQERERR